MKHHAHAPELKFSGPEPFALVPEQSIDWHERQRLAQQKLRHQAESELNQTRFQHHALPTHPTTG